MKLLKLTKFKTNPGLNAELADKISGTENNWQSINYEQYPSIMQLLSDNNLTSIRGITVSTTTGPLEKIGAPMQLFGNNGETEFAPYRIYIPLDNTTATVTYKIGNESMTIDSPVAAICDEEMEVMVTSGVSHMLRISFAESEKVGKLALISDQSSERKMETFAKFNGLI